MRQTTDRRTRQGQRASSLLVVRFLAYFSPLGLVVLPVGVAAQVLDHAGTPITTIAAEWVPRDESRPWRDVFDGALAAGEVDLRALTEAWSDTVANGITMDLSVQAITLPASVEAGPEMVHAAVDLLYWQVLTEHVMLLAEAEGLGLTA